MSDKLKWFTTKGPLPNGNYLIRDKQWPSINDIGLISSGCFSGRHVRTCDKSLYTDYEFAGPIQEPEE